MKEIRTKAKQAGNRRKTRGASVRRGAERSSSIWPSLAKGLKRSFAVTGVLAIAGGAVYFGKEFVEQASDRPVNSIGVEGQFSYLSQQEASAIVSPMMVDGFLQVPLAGIKRKLEENPWIAQASVSRRWPDKLYIAIVEEQPIARWGKAGFLNHKGDIVHVEAESRLGDLPLLSGNEGQEKLVMQNYQQLAQMLGRAGLKINEFYNDDLFSWNVVLSNGLEINIGRDQTMEKIQRFLVVYKRELHKRLEEVTAVDLRYGNGLAVEWKTTTADSAESAKSDKKA